MVRVFLIRRRLVCGMCLAFAWAALGDGPTARAGEIKLKNGTVLRGLIDKIDSLIVGPKKPKEGPVPYYPIYMVTTSLKRYFVPRIQEDTLNPEAELSKLQGFKIEQTRMPNGGKIITAVQGYAEKPSPFDPHGRRTVVLNSANGDLEVIQGMTLLTPEYAKVMALNFNWETYVATSSIPLKQLDAILRKNTKPNNSEDRLSIANFYIQAHHYELAEQELLAIGKEFPEMGGRVAAAAQATASLEED